MSFEVFDQPAKGKRRCPALGGWITALTCGKHRIKDIRCPSNCKHLGQHERYRHAKVSDEFHQAWAEKVVPLYQKQDRFGIDFLLFLEFALYQFLHEHPQATDAQVLEGLKFAHRQLSPIQVIEAVGNAAGKHLVAAIAEYQEQHPQFDIEKAQSMVEMLIEIFDENAKNDRDGINGFMGHLETHFDLSTVVKTDEDAEVLTPPKIIIPGT